MVRKRRARAAAATAAEDIAQDSELKDNVELKSEDVADTMPCRKLRRSTRRTRKRSPYFVDDDAVAAAQLKDFGRPTRARRKRRQLSTTTASEQDGELEVKGVVTERRPVSDDTFGLLQEVYAPDPFRVMLVALFCNQTPGKRARPFLAGLLERWPTVADLAAADPQHIADFIQPLGLFNTRARRIVLLAQAYLAQPPVLGDVSVRKVVKWYPPTEISHLPGAGPYAMDCYRIFCNPEGWRTCRPDDKELKVYIKWRWSKEGIDYDQLKQREPDVR